MRAAVAKKMNVAFVAALLTGLIMPSYLHAQTSIDDIKAMYEAGQKTEARKLLQDELAKVKKAATEIEAVSKSKQEEIDKLRAANPNYGKSGVSAFIKEVSASAATLTERLDASPTRFDQKSRPARLQEIKTAAQSPILDDVIRATQMIGAELNAELIAASRNVIFTASVYDHTGRKSDIQVVRPGLFNILSREGFINSDGVDLYLYERQPRRSIADNSLMDSTKTLIAGSAILAIDPTSPAKGQIMKSYVERPTVIERFHQGGTVGYSISILGVVMLVFAMYKVPSILVEAIKVSRQKKIQDSPSQTNILGRVLLSLENAQTTDLGQLEIVASSAIEEEMNKISKGVHFIKTSSLIAPLLGLLGTVTGMITTFQTITAFGAVDPQMVSAGISEAMVCTVLGLVVAIPAMFAHAIASSRTTGIASTVEVAALNKIAILALSETGRG